MVSFLGYAFFLFVTVAPAILLAVVGAMVAYRVFGTTLHLLHRGTRMQKQMSDAFQRFTSYLRFT